MNNREKHSSATGFALHFKASLLFACMAVLLHSMAVGAYPQVHGPKIFMSAPESGPCLGSLVGPPSMKGRCIPWQNNVRAVPSFDAARRYIFAGSILYALHVLDADTGREEGRILLKGRATTKTLFSPDGTRIFVGTDKGVVSAFDAFSFKHIFDFHADGRINDDIVIRDERIYFTSFLSTVYSVDYVSGKLDWQLERPMLRDRLKLSPQSNILFYEQGLGDKKSTNLMVAHPDGYVSVLSAKSGKVLRKVQVVQKQTSFPDIIAPMVERAGQLWVASYDAGLFGIDLLTWQIKQEVAVPNITQLAVFGDKIIAATTDALLAISPGGKVLWKNWYSRFKSRRASYAYPFKSFMAAQKPIFYGTPSQLLISGNRLAMGTSLGAIGFFDVTNGQLTGIAGLGLGFGPVLLALDGQMVAMTQSGSPVIFEGL